MKNFVLILLINFVLLSIQGQDLPLLKISDNNRYIVTSDNQPFFWLGGTAWEMIHRLTKEEIDTYLTDRAEKGFTVIQTVILAELDGLNTPNAYGQKPLINNDPTKLNEKYFELVDYVVKKSNKLGLYVGLLPTWGDKFNKAWGTGPEIFNPQNAEIYGELIAKRYLKYNNVIWILGGDRKPENEKHYSTIRAMAKGIRKVDSKHLITYHPSGANKASDFFNDDWLDFDMFQSGHGRNVKEYNYVLDSRKKTPHLPIVNGEARYENIRDRFWEQEKHGWLDDADVRVSAYWSMLSGAAGYTYGCNDIWQMYEIDKHPNLEARTGWTAALQLPGSTQMGYMRTIFEKIPWQSLVLDQSLITTENVEDESYIVAAIGEKKDIIVAYTPMGKAINIDASKLQSNKIDGFWFNPRSGKLKYIGEINKKGSLEFKPWSTGWGSDFLLILMDNKIADELK